MNRLILALSILAAGAALVCGLRNSASQLQSEAAALRGPWLAQTQHLAQLETQRYELTLRVRDLKQSLSHHARGTPESELLMGTNGSAHLPPDVRERLLAELGLGWNASGNYLVVSKDTLRQVGLQAVRDNRLRDTVCSVLAITPPERAEIEGTMNQLAAEFYAWAQSHAQRTEPSGDVLARYTLPSDLEFSQNLSNAFAASVLTGLGAERGGLMLDYAQGWMEGLGMRGTGPSMLTIKRPPAGQEELPFELRMPNNSRHGAAVSPHQPFPEAFLPIFPGGWAQVADVEGFELPKAFHQPKDDGGNP